MLKSIKIVFFLFSFFLLFSKTDFAQIADIYYVNPTKFEVLDGSNIPSDGRILENFFTRLTEGEEEPLSLLIKPHTKLTNVRVSISNLRSGQFTMPSTVVDPYIVKVWWQSSVNSPYQQGPKYLINSTESLNLNYPHPDSLVNELLIKDDNLVRVTTTYNPNLKNEIRMKRKSDGNVSYYNLSRADHRMPGENKGIGYEIKDSDVLLPFDMKDGRNKQLWFILKIPKLQKAGIYSGTITISCDQGILQSIPLRVEILPFSLEESILTYGIYYDGYLLDGNGDYGFGSGNRNTYQYELEMRDLLKHGIKYPATLNNVFSLGMVKTIRTRCGLPSDKVFISATCLPMIYYFNYKSGVPGYEQYDWNYISNIVLDYIRYLNSVGYSNESIYIMGADEKCGYDLYYLEDLYSWMVNTLGIKVWQAIAAHGWGENRYLEAFPIIGEELSLPVLLGYEGGWFTFGRIEKAIQDWSSVGKKPLLYGAPQVGYENPEIYRKNYGLRLYLEGYGGSFEYNYMAQKGISVWNDWDISEIGWRGPLRDMVYTYPVSNGLINTIQWEGRREGYDDVRYLSTLLKEINQSSDAILKIEALNFINGLNYGFTAKPDMDEVREKMIDYILQLKGVGTSFGIIGTDLSGQNAVTLKFSNYLDKQSAENAGNYFINKGVQVLSASLIGNGDQVRLTATAFVEGETYGINVSNVKDVNGNYLTDPGNYTNFTFSSYIAPLVKYDFIKREDPNTIYDISQYGQPLNLFIAESRAITWVNNGLSVHSPTHIHSDKRASKIIDACTKSNEITIEAWIKPANVIQNGPARIVSLANNSSNRNFMLGQGIDGGPSNVFEARLRTKKTNANGLPSTNSFPGSVNTKLMYVVYTRDALGTAKIFINCEEKGTAKIVGALSNWDNDFQLSISNEINGEQPWLGEFYFLAIYDKALNPEDIDYCYNAYSKGVEINAKVYLQGSFSKGSMKTDLNKLDFLPMNQPYANNPWKYFGTEKVRKLKENIVDWILVEIRADKGSSTIIARKAALLRDDGLVVDVDGNNNVRFSGITPGKYYLVIRHRNHLGIMSAEPIYLSSNSELYDFTNSPDKAYGTDALGHLGDSIYGMYSGDGDGNGIVNILDYGTVANNIFKVGYNSGDLDLSTTIDVVDYSKASQSMLKISKVPD